MGVQSEKAADDESLRITSEDVHCRPGLSWTLGDRSLEERPLRGGAALGRLVFRDSVAIDAVELPVLGAGIEWHAGQDEWPRRLAAVTGVVVPPLDFIGELVDCRGSKSMTNGTAPAGFPSSRNRVKPQNNAERLEMQRVVIIPKADSCRCGSAEAGGAERLLGWLRCAWHGPPRRPAETTPRS